MSATAPTLPDALSDATRAWLEGSSPHELLIGGERVAAADGRTFESLDPATGKPIASIAWGGEEDVDRAVKAARAAFDGGKWVNLAPGKRTAIMLKLADLVAENADQLAELESLDNGKPVTLAKIVDVGQTVAHLQYYAGWPSKIHGETIPTNLPNTLPYTRKQPLGVCGQIVPWNFPLLMAAWKVAPALAAGCTIVLKPAEQTPLTALR